MNPRPGLLIVTETLALPWLNQAATAAGFAPSRCRSVREAIASCRQSAPAAVLAEYHFNPTYSSYTSTLESLIAGLQKYAPHTCLVVIAENDRREHLRPLQARFAIHTVVYQPVRRGHLTARLREAAGALAAAAAVSRS